jgi:hypothetical protein
MIKKKPPKYVRLTRPLAKIQPVVLQELAGMPCFCDVRRVCERPCTTCKARAMVGA